MPRKTGPEAYTERLYNRAKKVLKEAFAIIDRLQETCIALANGDVQLTKELESAILNDKTRARTLVQEGLHKTRACCYRILGDRYIECFNLRDSASTYERILILLENVIFDLLNGSAGYAKDRPFALHNLKDYLVTKYNEFMHPWWNGFFKRQIDKVYETVESSVLGYSVSKEEYDLAYTRLQYINVYRITNDEQRLLIRDLMCIVNPLYNNFERTFNRKYWWNAEDPKINTSEDMALNKLEINHKPRQIEIARDI